MMMVLLSLIKSVGGGGWGGVGVVGKDGLLSLLLFHKKFVLYLAVEEAQQMYQLRKVALEARRNKPDLNCHYTKIKVP